MRKAARVCLAVLVVGFCLSLGVAVGVARIHMAWLGLVLAPAFWVCYGSYRERRRRAATSFHPEEIRPPQ
jgi:hypothetical protein